MIVPELFTNFAATLECVNKAGNEATFFGLKPWYHYINDADHFKGCDITNFTLLGKDTDIPAVLVAVVDDLLRIAALFAVGFVIVGAIQMMVSQGSPDETAKAQQTVVNALIGLAVAIVAVAFVSFVGNRF